MFGKLIKHEMRATGRIMLPLIIALPCLGLLSNLADRLVSGPNGLLNKLRILILFVFAMSCIAIVAMAFVVMILRYYRSLHSDEGYLTNTLPVSVHGIIWSRMVVAAVYFVLSMAVLGLSMMLMNLSKSFIEDITRLLRMFAHINISLKDNSEFVWQLAEFAGVVLVYCVSKCLQFYAAISTGHAFGSRRGLMSVIAYAVLQTVFIVITVKVLQLPFIASAQPEAFLGYAAAGLALYGAVCYFISAFSVKRKLNLA